MTLGGKSYVPSVNFFGALSDIGDTFAQGRAEARDAALLGAQPQPSFIDRLMGVVSPQKPAEIEGAVTPAVSAGASGDLLSAFSQAGERYGVSPSYLSRTAQIESGMDPNAHNPSGATGLMQFVPSTARQYGLSNPRDPAASIDAAARLAADNKRALTAALGRVPSDAELYLAHQQGAGGASKLLANPNAPAVDVVGRQAVIQNGGRPDMTASEFAHLWTGRYSEGGQPVQVADASGRVPVGVATPTRGLPPADDATVAILKTFPPGLQTPEGITRAMQVGSPHVRAIAEKAFSVYTQALANQATREQHQAEFSLRRQDMLASQAARQQELDLRRQEREDTRSARQQELDLKRQERAEVGEKQTGEQANAATFATRMHEADKIISDPAIYGAGMGFEGGTREAVKNAPFVGDTLAGVGAKGEAFQKFDQARRDFVNAILRKESGAAITPAEFANAEKQYFPVPGNKPGVIEQKARNRATAIDTIAQGGTNTFRKEFATKRAKSSGGPAVGAVEDGYRFKGGNPADPSAWERAQ